MIFNCWKRYVQNTKSDLKRIHISLTSVFAVIPIIILTLGEHIINQTNRQQIQLGHRKAELFASQQKQRRCHFSVSRAMFF